LQFKDLNCAEGTKKYYDIRDGVGIDRDTGTSRDGAKYNYEVTPAGTKFELYIIGDNLDDKDLSLFKLCINLLKSGDISIGGMTSRGLGSIRLIDEKLYKVDKSNLKEYAFNGLKEEMRCEDV
jgi:CRISPR/Cas system CSM-associated protein Csm3 (group 7 of RAMP superfamily)